MIALLTPPWAFAQIITTSPAPDQVGVTVYRAPDRPADQPINLSWLNGYALITEVRRVSIPAGEADIRFEGVAGGILPESAIVTGLPAGVVEKNQDAYLLSPASLIDASLGKRVHLRRISRATGAVREMEAVVRSSAQGGVVLQTEGGFEALRCTGLAETVTYDRVPPGLSAKPTLSVRVRSERPAEASVTLSYLASGFDWQANYVADLSPDGNRLDLFGWLTLANADETGFRNANTNAVAGRLNRTSGPAMRPRAEPLRLECWPAGTTSDVATLEQFDVQEDIVVTGTRMMAPPPPPPPPPPPAPPPPPEMMARQEELGDLKLYRIPEPVTVAAKSQKQVALLRKPGVKVRTVYRASVYGNQPFNGGTRRILLTKNEGAQGLGLPLPSGRVVLFAKGAERPILIGRGSVNDTAVGEEVEIDVAEAFDVRVQTRVISQDGRGAGEYELIVTNARNRPVPFEARFDAGGLTWSSTSTTARRNGRPVWRTTVPANGRATFSYRLEAPGP